MIRLSYYFSLCLLFFLSENIQGQCIPLRFNTSVDSGWKTCTTSPSPNESRGDSYWLHYDLGEAHQLGESWVWNYNNFGDIESGVTQFVIDYMDNGGNWVELGTYEVSLADGTSTYEGQDGPNFEGLITSEVLITFLDNGGSDCYGIGEWKISTVEVEISHVELIESNSSLEVYPNPTSDELNIIASDIEISDSHLTITDYIGRQILSRPMSQSTLIVNVAQLESGIYTACVNSQNIVMCKQFSVLTR